MQTNSLFKGTFIDYTIPAGQTTVTTSVTTDFQAKNTIVGAVQKTSQTGFSDGAFANFVTSPSVGILVSLGGMTAVTNTIVRVFFNEDIISPPSFPVK